MNNYAHLVATRMHFKLVDVSCSGATTKSILSAWNELPAQIDAITPDTMLVTITVGGNDVNYIGELYRSVCIRFGPQAPQQTCQPVVPVSEGDWTLLEERMRSIANEVRRRAPESRLVFVDYLRVIPDAEVCASLPLDADQLARSRATFKRLATLTARIAREAHADLLPAGMLSSGHDTCSTDPWAQGYPAKLRPWHPTAAGHAAIATALAKLLQP